MLTRSLRDGFAARRRTRALAALATACAALAAPGLASAHACGAIPQAFIDGDKGAFDNYNDSTGYPVFNQNHCYGHPIFADGTGKQTFDSNPYGTYTNTNSGFGFQCAELAYRYFWFRYKKRLVLYAASDLCNGPLPDGVTRFRPNQGTPVPGDIIVFGPNSCGADPTYGHIAVVTRWWNKDSVQIAQQNTLSPSTTIANVHVTCACAFLHAVENTHANGAPVATPAGTWTPSGTSGSTAVNGNMSPGQYGRMPDLPPSGCYAASNDQKTMWPPACKSTP